MTTQPSLFKSSFIIGGLTMMSRIFGLIRDVFLAALLGSSAQADAFIVAFRLPNLFRRLFAEGAFSAAFIPIYAAERSEAQAAFAGHILSIVSLALLLLTILAEIFMEGLVFLLAGGFADDPDKFALAVLLSRIMFPYLICMFLTALYGAVLNAAFRFVAAAAAPILLNLVLIGAALASWIWGGAAVFYLSWGVALAGIAQAAMMIAACARAGLMPFPLRFTFTPAIRKFFTLLMPALATGGVVQINILVGTRIASSAPSAVSHIYYAERLYQLPLAVIGIAIGAALLPALAQTIHDPQTARRATNRALEGALLLTLPASAALIIIAEPIIAALFEYGNFTSIDCAASALILIGFAAGLPAFVIQRVLSAAFFARQNTQKPFHYALYAMLINVALSLILFPYLGAFGIAVATSLAAWAQAFALLRRARQNLWLEPLWRPVLLIMIAAVCMTAALYGCQILYPLPDASQQRILYLAALIIFGLLIYLALCHMLKLVRLSQLKREFL